VSKERARGGQKQLTWLWETPPAVMYPINCEDELSDENPIPGEKYLATYQQT
jgi:hypothetical protein